MRLRLRGVLAAGVLMGAGLWLAGQQAAVQQWLDRQFPITRVAVGGELRHLAPEALADWLEPRVAGGFFTADLEALRRAVEARPWVREARLRRRWPGTLAVRVAEHRPRARWVTAEDERLVSRRGAVFAAAPRGALEALPRLVGPRSRIPALLERLGRLEERLGTRYRVSRLGVDARGAWSAEVDGRVTIRFGRKHWKGRLTRLLRVHRGWKLLDRAVTRVDLRYPDGLAVAVAEADGEPNQTAPDRARPGTAARL
jgi:cell division protein FtsQ